jgi:hypothetical protein
MMGSTTPSTSSGPISICIYIRANPHTSWARHLVQVASSASLLAEHFPLITRTMDSDVIPLISKLLTSPVACYSIYPLHMGWVVFFIFLFLAFHWYKLLTSSCCLLLHLSLIYGPGYVFHISLSCFSFFIYASKYVRVL